MHTVFSVDNSSYLHWQAELLAYSMQKAGQSGALTRLLSSDEPMSAFQMGHTFQTRSYAWRGIDDYCPRNRVYALRDWLASGLPEEETIFILDPDCVFLSTVEDEVEQGGPIGQDIPYMKPQDANNQELARRHGFKPEKLQPLGIPIVIHREDLREILPIWIQWLETLRDDPQSRKSMWADGWMAEMWAYVFAASKIGLWHEIRPLAQFQNWNSADCPITHYCYDTRAGDWQWSKRTYHAWEPVELPLQGELPRASVALLQLLNEYAEIRRTQKWN